MEKKVKNEKSGEKIKGEVSASTSPVHDPQPTTPMMKIKGKKVKNSKK